VRSNVRVGLGKRVGAKIGTARIGLPDDAERSIEHCQVGAVLHDQSMDAPGLGKVIRYRHHLGLQVLPGGFIELRVGKNGLDIGEYGFFWHGVQEQAQFRQELRAQSGIIGNTRLWFGTIHYRGAQGIELVDQFQQGYFTLESIVPIARFSKLDVMHKVGKLLVVQIELFERHMLEARIETLVRPIEQGLALR